MADSQKSVMFFRCPWCFRKGNDSAGLVYDARKGEHYCQKCCFTGNEGKIRFEYQQFKSKYALLTKRLDILKELHN
jgi:hypothetical protein